MKNKKIVPKLRFPEFREVVNWKKKSLDGVSEINPSIEKLPETFAYIDLESVNCGTLTKKQIINFEDAPSRAQRLLKDGDIIFQLVRPYQRNNFLFRYNENDTYNYVASTGYAQIRSRECNTYLFHYLHTDNFVDRVIAKCTGSSYPAINSKDLAKIQVIIPSIPEQQKIADCLSSLDDLITAHTKKLYHLKTHKKGLMQQLFPAEGETVPKLRFPEFREAGEWEVKPIEQLLTIGSGRDYKHLSSGDVPVYGTGGYMLSVDDYLYDGESVCIGRKGTIDKPIFLTGKFWTVDTLFYTHSFKDCLPAFIYLCFQNINWLEYNEASGVPSLSKVIINKIELGVPSLKEQQKIDDCLSSLDDLITTQTQKIKALRLHKKGLMQQLFPTTDEVDSE
jgi:type I restriction enzyme S subunit